MGIVSKMPLPSATTGVTTTGMGCGLYDFKYQSYFDGSSLIFFIKGDNTSKYRYLRSILPVGNNNTEYTVLDNNGAAMTFAGPHSLDSQFDPFREVDTLYLTDGQRTFKFFIEKFLYLMNTVAITNPAGTTARYTCTVDPPFSSAFPQTGQSVNVWNGDLTAGNKGNFTVTGQGANYFEVTNAAVVAETKYGFAQISSSTTNNLSLMSDTEGTPVALTGTLTFSSSSRVVTGASTAFLTEIQKGYWIRKSSSDEWNEVEFVVNDTTLFLRAIPTSTGAGGAGTSQKASTTPWWSTYRPLFFHIWKNRLWAANFGIYGANNNRFRKANLLACTDVLTSATPQAYEKWGGSYANARKLFVGDTTDITGIQSIGDYLFIFKEGEYRVYQYNESITPPLQEVRQWDYGNITPPVKIGNYLIYFTGTQARKTNGFEDVSISDGIDFDFLFKNTNYIWDSYYNFVSDNYSINSFFDKARNHYRINMPIASSTGALTTSRISYVYDLSINKWIGTATNYQYGDMINWYNYYSNSTSKEAPAVIINGTHNTSVAVMDLGDTNTDNTNAGILESTDMFFDDIKSDNYVDFIEFWIHVGVASGAATPTSVTFNFNYYLDGQAALANDIQIVVTNSSTTDTTFYKKIRFRLSNAKCKFFRWKLSDTAWSGGNSPISIIGGIIGYTESEGN